MTIAFEAMTLVAEDVHHCWASRLDPTCMEAQAISMFMFSDILTRRMPAEDVCSLMRVLEEQHKRTCRRCVSYGGISPMKIMSKRSVDVTAERHS